MSKKMIPYFCRMSKDLSVLVLRFAPNTLCINVGAAIAVVDKSSMF